LPRLEFQTPARPTPACALVLS